MPSLSPGHSSAHAGLCFKRSDVPCPLPPTQCFPSRPVNRSLPGLCNQVPTSCPESPSGQKGSPLGNGPRGPSPGPCSLTCRAAQERSPAAFCGCGLSCSSRSARIVQCLWQARSPFRWRALSCTLGQAWADCVSSVCCSLHNSAQGRTTWKLSLYMLFVLVCRLLWSVRRAQDHVLLVLCPHPACA